MGEFLASGRPLLVHAPAETFLVHHIRKHDAGTVVDAPDPERLAAALDQIIARPEEVAHKVENALRLAEIYRASTARELFRALLRETTSRKRLQ
jgi:hypothetical protein